MQARFPRRLPVGSGRELMGSLGADFDEDALSLCFAVARRMAARWSRCPGDADDVAQEAMLRLLRQETAPQNAAAWLFVVTRRIAGRMHTRDAARAAAEWAYAMEERPRPLGAELLVDVSMTLDQLGDRDRELLVRVAGGMLSRDIAEELGCAVKDVGQMVSRARRRARRARDGD